MAALLSQINWAVIGLKSRDYATWHHHIAFVAAVKSVFVVWIQVLFGWNSTIDSTHWLKARLTTLYIIPCGNKLNRKQFLFYSQFIISITLLFKKLTLSTWREFKTMFDKITETLHYSKFILDIVHSSYHMQLKLTHVLLYEHSISHSIIHPGQ